MKSHHACLLLCLLPTVALLAAIDTATSDASSMDVALHETSRMDAGGP